MSEAYQTPAAMTGAFLGPIFLARTDISCYTFRMDDRHPDKKRARQDKRLDEALKETFPASDPVAVAPIDKPDPDAPPPKP